jgi:hypothetical protein
MAVLTTPARALSLVARFNSYVSATLSPSIVQRVERAWAAADYGGVITLFTTALSKDRSNVDLLIARANLQLLLGRADRAFIDLDSYFAHPRNTSSLWPYFCSAKCSAALKRMGETRYLLQQLIPVLEKAEEKDLLLECQELERRSELTMEHRLQALQEAWPRLVEIGDCTCGPDDPVNSPRVRQWLHDGQWPCDQCSLDYQPDPDVLATSPSLICDVCTVCK